MLSALLDRPIAFHRVFVDVTGSVPAALFLSQVVYWSRRTSDPDGWFFKTATEWRDETGLGRYELENARSALRRLGVLQETRAGVPAKLFFRLDDERLEELLVEVVDARRTSKQERWKPTNKNAGNQQTGMPETSKLYNTETTPETTTDIPGAPRPGASSARRDSAGKSEDGDTAGKPRRSRKEAPPASSATGEPSRSPGGAQEAAEGAPVETPAQRLVRLTVARVVETEEPSRKEFVAAAKLCRAYPQAGAVEVLAALYGEWAETHDPRFGGFSLATFASVVGGMIAKRRKSFDADADLARVEAVARERGLSWEEAERVVEAERGTL